MASKLKKLTVALVQMSMSERPDDNLAKAERLVRDAAARGARLVCLPELFRSRYFCQSEDSRFFDLAERIPGPTTQRFEAIAKDLGLTIVLSLFEARAPGLYHNTAVVVDGARGSIGKYRKMHIPDDPRYYEKFYFTPGDLGFRAFDASVGPLGVLVCWDQWYPEAARLTALKGAEILVYPTAIGWHPEEKDVLGARQHDAWETAQRAHAIANGCFVLTPNRIGFEPDPTGKGGIQFWGQSFVAAPDGHIVARASADREELVVVDIDLSEVRSHRIGWPFLRDRRIEAYGDITRRFIDD